MKHRFGTLLGAFAMAALLAGSREARAQVTPAGGYTPPDDTPSIGVGATIFADYTYQADPVSKDSEGNIIHPNAFNVTRAYINVTGNISHWVSFRITPDVVRVGTTPSGDVPGISGTLAYRLKYAYGQINFSNVGGTTGPWLTNGDWVRLGLQQTPFVDFTEQIYRYRFQGTIFAERETVNGFGFLTSSDLGASIHWVFPGNFGDIHGGVYNGEGYARAEANDMKSWQIRGTLRPAPMVPILKGLRLTGFYDGDSYVRGGEKQRTIAMATFEHPYCNGGFYYLWANDQTSPSKALVESVGYTAWLTPQLPNGIGALLRYDWLEPNKNLPGVKKRYIAGLAYWFPVAKSGIAAALMPNFEEVKYEGFAVGDANRKPEERRWILSSLFNF